MSTAMLNVNPPSSGLTAPAEPEGRAASGSDRGPDASPEPAFDRIARLEALLAATGDAAVAIDPAGHVASLNRAADAMFGVEPGECVGWNIDRLISSGVDIDREVPTLFERTGRRKDGSEFPLQVARAEWIDAQGRPASGMILRDLTDRHRVEAELCSREAASQALEKLAALGRVAGGVAHELNNLLQPVIGLAQLELETLPESGTPQQMDTRESIATILESGDQMRNVVLKILTLSRKAKPELAPTDFPGALRRTMALVGRLLPPGVRLDEGLKSDVLDGVAAINEPELIAVMTKLAVNAAEAMLAHGTLSIALDRIDLAGQAATALKIGAGSYFRVQVRDTGSGMDAATRAHIFEPFFTTKPIGEGSGLGLSMVEGVLRGWKGTVAVDSAVGRGTTFSLYIPVAEAR